MTVNGTGPATSWMAEKTLVADLDESVVPEPPSGIKAMSSDTTISIAWLPPRHNRIMVRGIVYFLYIVLEIQNDLLLRDLIDNGRYSVEYFNFGITKLKVTFLKVTKFY